MTRSRLPLCGLVLAGLLMPLTLCGAELALSPENTRIQFVGTHVGDKPDPRTGHFATFSGTAVSEQDQLKSVTIEIQTRSLTTDIEKLTNHLKSPDFLDVNAYPTARFISTSITPAAEGKATIKGKFTLHGVTREITLPATLSLDANGQLKLRSEFNLDRTEFGMDFATDRVHKNVAMTVTIGG